MTMSDVSHTQNPENVDTREQKTTNRGPAVAKSTSTAVDHPAHYNHGGADCGVTVLPDGKLRVAFPTPQRAVTPGQAVVLYTDSGAVLGGGTIEAE